MSANGGRIMGDDESRGGSDLKENGVTSPATGNGCAGPVSQQVLDSPFIENSKRVIGAVRTMQSRDHWLQHRAADKLGFDYKGLLRIDRSLSNKRPDAIVARAQAADLTPARRWCLAYKIRKANMVWAGKLVDRLKEEALVAPGADVILSTVCTEEMVDDVEIEREWSRATVSTRELKGLNEDFTGDLDVIVDMESCTKSNVERMLSWLESTGACRVFNEVDGPWSRWLWSDDGWTEETYPVIKAKWEQ